MTLMDTATTHPAATKRDILTAARAFRGQQFTTARLETVLRVHGRQIVSLDVAAHVEAVLTANGYFTNEAGVFAAA